MTEWCRLYELVWGPYCFLLLSGIPWEPGRNIHVCLPEPGGQAHHPVLLIEQLPGQLPALSPGGAFICTFQPQSNTLRVHDVRSGDLELQHAFGTVGGGELWGATTPLWSSCGSRVVACTVQVAAGGNRVYSGMLLLLLQL